MAIDVRAGEQIVHRADAVPDLPASEVRSGKVGKVSQHGVFGADQVVTALLRLRVPELAALTLPDRVPTDDEVAALDQSLANILVVNLSLGRVAGSNKDGGMHFGAILRHVYERGYIKAGEALIEELFDVEAIACNPAGDGRLQVGLLRGKTADHLQKRCL